MYVELEVWSPARVGSNAAGRILIWRAGRCALLEVTLLKKSMYEDVPVDEMKIRRRKTSSPFTVIKCKPQFNASKADVVMIFNIIDSEHLRNAVLDNSSNK
jgi:hypothetical protein